jgi:transcriptional regulator with XRE-family HTH domain
MPNADTRVATAVWGLAQKQEMTVKVLAERLQLPYRTVQNYLTGKVKIPALFIERCCDVFGVEADYLLFGRVGIDVVAVEDAIRSVLASVIARLELEGQTVTVGKESKPQLSERSQFHHDAAVVGEIAMAMQREYERLRTSALNEHGRGNVNVRAKAVSDGLAEASWHD